MSEEVLSLSEIERELKRCPEWEIQGKKIIREWEFEDFMEAMDFVNRVADVAEAAAHHPDIDIRYNKVRLGLTTHEMDGVTDADIEVAHRIDNTCDDK